MIVAKYQIFDIVIETHQKIKKNKSVIQISHKIYFFQKRIRNLLVDFRNQDFITLFLPYKALRIIFLCVSHSGFSWLFSFYYKILKYFFFMRSFIRKDARFLFVDKVHLNLLHHLKNDKDNEISKVCSKNKIDNKII